MVKYCHTCMVSLLPSDMPYKNCASCRAANTFKNLRRYNRLKSESKCVDCTGAVSNPNSVRCEACGKSQKKKRRARYLATIKADKRNRLTENERRQELRDKLFPWP
jgi:hypothetical protein